MSIRTKLALHKIASSFDFSVGMSHSGMSTTQPSIEQQQQRWLDNFNKGLTGSWYTNVPRSYTGGTPPFSYNAATKHTPRPLRNKIIVGDGHNEVAFSPNQAKGTPKAMTYSPVAAVDDPRLSDRDAAVATQGSPYQYEQYQQSRAKRAQMAQEQGLNYDTLQPKTAEEVGRENAQRQMNSYINTPDRSRIEDNAIKAEQGRRQAAADARANAERQKLLNARSWDQSGVANGQPPKTAAQRNAEIRQRNAAAWRQRMAAKQNSSRSVAHAEPRWGRGGRVVDF